MQEPAPPKAATLRAADGPADRITDIHGERTPYVKAWSARQDERVVEEPDRWVRSACVLCSTGCAVDIAVKDDRIVGVRGRVDDHVNKGRLGPKGLYGWEANNSSDRLTMPLVRRDGQLVEASWDEAMGLIAGKARSIMQEHGPGALGFYCSGQLFLEDYYTLSKLVLGGIGTPHLDGNTRLCTATAGEALQESFGADGQPGCYEDIDHADTLFLVGHNMAETQTVLWMRVLDRLEGLAPPALVVMDPRRTMTAQKATVHLAPKPGTNLAVLNCILHVVIKNGWVDERFIAQHTIGYEELCATTRAWTPKRAEGICEVPAARLEEAAEVIGSAQRLVSTCLQGVYQSNQATASACQVNNLHLIRGMLGRPGCSVFQMNGQPAAQNTRETGCSSNLPGLRNWANEDQVQQLAFLWNVQPEKIPHWGPLTDVMRMMKYVEQGSIKMLWVLATNPAASLPQLARIRELLKNEELFLVVNDCFPTETTELASVVLPAAIWGEKTGTFTNADRTVHLSMQAVPPPGEARTDMAILLDFAQRMELHDKDHQPLLKHVTPEEAFNEWRTISRGRPCDYSGMSYAKLAEGSMHWPCNEQYPDGAERLYTDGHFASDAAYAENYGHDLLTGGHTEQEDYKAHDPAGRAIIKSADFALPAETPDGSYPLLLTTGRAVHQFHTRTKTGRSPELNAAAPEAYVVMSAADAAQRGIAEGDLVRVRSRRGMLEAPARLEAIAEGAVFIPMHYGYWDGTDHRRAANELTLSEWDPVSKQPMFKYAAVEVERIEAYSKAAPADERTADLPIKGKAKKAANDIGAYVSKLLAAHTTLAGAMHTVAERHADEHDLVHILGTMATWSAKAAEELKPALILYGRMPDGDAGRLARNALSNGEHDGLAVLHELLGLLLLVHEVELCTMVVSQAAKAKRDAHLLAQADKAELISQRQRKYLETRLKTSAPQALLIPV